MKTLYLLVLTAVAWLVSLAAAHAFPVSDYRLSGAHLTVSNVYDIRQDDEGYMWFGTNAGLVRYDGYRFVYFPTSIIPGNLYENERIGNVYPVSRQGLLWIKTAAYLWRCMDLKTMNFVAYAGAEDMSKTYKKQFVDSGGGLWMFDGKNGLRHATVDGGKVSVVDIALPTKNVINVLEDGGHNVWAMTGDGAFIVSGSVRTVFRGKSCIASNSVDGDVLILLPDNDIALYQAGGKRKWIKRITGAPLLHTIRSQFVWHGKWVICTGGCYIINISMAKAEAKVPGLYDGQLLDSMDGYFFESNNSDTLWVFTPDGTIRTLRLSLRSNVTMSRNRKYTICRGPGNIFFIATYGNGLYLWDSKVKEPEKALVQYTAEQDMSPVTNNYLSTAFVSRDGTLWLAQEMAGVVRVTVRGQDATARFLPKPAEKGYWSNFIRAIGKDRQGNVVVSNMSGDVYVWRDGLFTRQGSLRSSAFAFLTDRQGHQWTALRGKGVQIDGVDYLKGSQDGHPFPSYDVADMVEDKFGRIWLSTYGDGLIMAEQPKEGGTWQFKQYLNSDINAARQHQMFIDSRQRLWMATSDGLFMLDTRKRKVSPFDFRHFSPANSPLLSHEVVCVAVYDNDLWVGTNGNGLQHIDIGGKWKTVRTYTLRNGFPSNSIASISRAADGSLWVATDHGLASVSGDEKKVAFMVTGEDDGRDVYVEGAVMELARGVMLFGTMNGLTVVNIAKANARNDHDKIPKVAVTDLLVNGFSVTDSITDINLKSKVSLASYENSLTFQFSTLNYSSQGITLYQYYLEGLDKTWHQPVTVSEAGYNNLSPGNYTLHVRAVVNGKPGQETVLKVKVHEPWYNTWWAWIIWLSAVCLLAYYVFRNMRTRLRLRQQIQMEKLVNSLRIEFFTHVAHEFRTPLAIISHAVGRLKGESDRQEVVTAKRGVKRLQRLVKQLLDFRRISTGNRHLCVREDDIVVFVRDIVQDFSDMAQQQSKTLTFLPFASHYKVAFDHDAVETIVYNLVSNALKYIRNGDAVNVTMTHSEGMLRLAVNDSGPGIDAERQKQLFKPFMQGLASQGGMGIGLYSSYSLAELHHGNLSYAPAESHGSVFTLELPDDSGCYTEEETDRTPVVADNKDEAEKESLSMIRRMKGNALNDITVAIVEDDPDMMEQIDGEVSVFFKTRRYMTGQGALEGICADCPAMVLCDVMLPDTSGYDIVKILKGDAATGYIPVVMLTALDDERHRLKSYECGADDYFTKPCNYRLLIGRMVQLIKQNIKAEREDRRVEREESEDGMAKSEGVVLTSVYDRNFLNRLDMLIGENLSNENLDVNVLAASLHVGRTKLFERVKELTGMTPVKYIQELRMKEAARLLKEGDLNVAEVGCRVGMSNNSYFAQVFKARYGMPPGKWAKSVTN